MTCDPLLRWAMPFSTAGYHAVPLDLVCPVYYPAIQPSYTAFRALLFRPPPPGIGPAETKIRRTLLAVEAALPLKSP